MKKLLFIIVILFAIKINAQEIKFGKVSNHELKEKFNPKDSTANATYLLKKRKTHFVYSSSKGFQVVTEYHERIKIYKKKGVDYATKKITYYDPKSGDKERISNLKAYSFNLVNNKIEKNKLSKKDIFDEKLNKYRSQKKITFPNITVGTIIDIKYTLTSPYWSIETLNFQYGIPVKKIDYDVRIPEYFFFNLKNKGYFNITPKLTNKKGEINWKTRTRTSTRASRGGTTIRSEVNNHQKKFNVVHYTFNSNNIPSLKENEPYIGNINNYRGGCEFELSGTRFPNSLHKNYATSWESVCKTIYGSSNFGDELRKTTYYKNELKAILDIAKNEQEKIFLIFQFVKSKVKWNNYYGKYTEKGVKKAYKEGSGNVAEINLILTSMLRSVGLKANPVLISTKNNGTPIFPTREGFNYVISKVNLSNEKYVLLDATDKYSTANIIPYRALNWYGREILEGGYSRQVKLIPSRPTKENNILQIKINDLGEINGMLRKSLAGHSAMFYRKKNNIRKEDDFISSLEEKYSIEIEEFKILNKENISKPITQTLKFTSEDFIEEINSKLYFSPLFFLGIKENPFKSEERNFPVDYGMPWQDKFSISITIPEGYSVESYPKNLAVGLPDDLGVFKYQINVQGNKIKLSSIIQINSNIISPQYYSTLKGFYKQLVEKQAEKIVLINK